MTPPPRPRIRLIDAPDESGRTTTTLLASLAARLASLYSVSGADAIGSLAAGLARLGREVSQTAEGRRLRQAIESGRAGTNGELLWSKVLIGSWISSLPPSPVLEHLRNDLALLLAGDLSGSLELGIVPAGYAGEQGALAPEPSTFIDYILGLWAFAGEARNAIEMLARFGMGRGGSVVLEATDPSHEESELLR